MKTLFKLTAVFSFFISFSVNANHHCQNYQSYSTKQYVTYEDCPCFSSSADLKAVLENSIAPTACESNNDFSVLTGGSMTVTSQDNGDVFSCYYRNVETDNKTESVKYGTREEVNNMHTACNAVMKQFARDVGINCK